jgi:hypothetical protein
MPAKREAYVQIDVGLESSRVVRALADRLAEGAPGSVPSWLLKRAVVGCLSAVWGAMLTARPDGDVRDVDDEEIELWAGWRGDEGTFAQAFRELFTDDGIVVGWERYDALATKKAADRERQRVAREKRRHADRPRDVTATPPETPNPPRIARTSRVTPPEDHADVTPTVAVTSRGLSAICSVPEEKRRETAVLPPRFAEGGSTDSLELSAVQEPSAAAPAAGSPEAPPPAPSAESGVPEDWSAGRFLFAKALERVRGSSAPTSTATAVRLARLLSPSILDGPLTAEEGRTADVLGELLHAAERVSESKRVQLRAALQSLRHPDCLDEVAHACGKAVVQVGPAARSIEMSLANEDQRWAMIAIALCTGLSEWNADPSGDFWAIMTRHLRTVSIPCLRVIPRRSIRALVDASVEDSQETAVRVPA